MGTSSTLPARARDRRREQIASLLGDDAALAVDDVPQFDTPAERSWWIAERLVSGLWRAEHRFVLAEAWGCGEGTVRNYATVAAQFVELLTNDTGRLAELSATHIAKLSQLSGDDRVRLDAHKTILQLTGHLRGGPERPSMTEAERDERIIASLRDPDPHTERLLREALSNPGDGLRRVLAEFGFGVVTAEGSETP